MSPTVCVDPAVVAAKARSTYTARRRRWLTDPDAAELDSLTMALNPPTESAVATDPDRVVAWVRGWRSYTGAGDVEWQTRRWPSFGAQQVPTRVVLGGATRIAAAAGRSTEWATLTTRRDRLIAAVAPDAPDFPAAVAATATKWEALDDNDFVRLSSVLRWLLANPASNLLIRQLPVPGVDTKWIGRHRGLVQSLVVGAGGSTDLGIRSAPPLLALAVLDRTLLPGAPRTFAAPLAELAALPLAPRRVLILENKEGLHALPDWPGTVAVHGSGYTVPELAALPWIASGETWYWGDLDSHGFAILDRLRRHLPAVRSVLMDPETLARWSELAVPEPSVASGDFDLLTTEERTALGCLRDGDRRLEQERIPWVHVLDRLEHAWGTQASRENHTVGS
ncbi:DUF3322 domain-containing protein [Prescottella equi]|uniref:DUF3322 domain-containing protein n=1 Tax=Rhodococcus hoagii TaxID=43767 RepID=UPI0007CD58C2|nr:DUF3322 domain-containing protein [Prescottella equi]